MKYMTYKNTNRYFFSIKNTFFSVTGLYLLLQFV